MREGGIWTLAMEDNRLFGHWDLHSMRGGGESNRR